MDEFVQNGQFKELENANPAPVDAETIQESTEIFPDLPQNEEIPTPPPFEQNEVSITNPEVKEKPSLSDKIADYLGIVLSLLFMTAAAGLALAFFFTFIPGIKFTFLHFLKCWAGVGAGLLIRGILTTNV